MLNDLLPSEAIQPHTDAPDDPRQVQDRQMAQVHTITNIRLLLDLSRSDGRL